MIRIIIDPSPQEAEQPMPSWQPNMFLPMCAESLAEQRELFPGLTETSERKPANARDLDQTTSMFDTI